MDHESKFSQYTQILEAMLNRLRNEIDLNTNAEYTVSDLDSLDEYIHALNSFYYKSFNDFFFPQFVNLMNNEISGKLKLRGQEDRLQQDIITILQRYTKLYNQVKTISNLLSDSRHVINGKLIAATRYQYATNADFIFAIKQLQDNLQLFKSFSLDLLQLAEDKPFMSALQQIPDFNALTQLVLRMDFNSQNDLKETNALLSHFTNLGNLLQDNSREFWGNEENAAGLAENIKLSVDEYNRKAPVSINRYYNKHIKNQLMVYVQLLSPGSKTTSKASFTLAKSFKEWIDSLTMILERSIYYSINNNNMLPYLTSLMSLPAEYARVLNTWVIECLEDTSKLYKEFSEASKPDFTYFCQQTEAIINKYSDKISMTDWRASSPDSSPLPYWQRRLSLELSSLTYLMDFIKGKHQHSSILMDKYLEVVNLLDTYLNLLFNIRSDLERLLAPRNISRAWKDIYIMIDRIPMEKGKVFPNDYLSLLQDHQFRKNISEAQKNTILHEEGDLFIIRVENQTILEVPNLILAD